ncbi:MAG: chromophore lyase CpcT/CpeT [Acidobacteriota bacterium]
MIARHFAVISLVCLVGLVSSPMSILGDEVTRPAAEELELLVAWMQGSFSSAAQAESTEGYFDIRLEMRRIWPQRDDGVWLYVEQATASRLEAPYRQRVYRVAAHPAGDGRWISEVYSLPGDALRFAGAHDRPELLDGLEPGQLAERTGCAVVLRRDGERFVGSTVEAECESSLRGAAYATSEVDVAADGLTTWDRGYDADGAQVWGAEAGPYLFARVPSADD